MSMRYYFSIQWDFSWPFESRAHVSSMCVFYFCSPAADVPLKFVQYTDLKQARDKSLSLFRRFVQLRSVLQISLPLALHYSHF